HDVDSLDQFGESRGGPPDLMVPCELGFKIPIAIAGPDLKIEGERRHLAIQIGDEPQRCGGESFLEPFLFGGADLPDPAILEKGQGRQQYGEQAEQPYGRRDSTSDSLRKLHVQRAPSCAPHGVGRRLIVPRLTRIRSWLAG